MVVVHFQPSPAWRQMFQLMHSASLKHSGTEGSWQWYDSICQPH